MLGLMKFKIPFACFVSSVFFPSSADMVDPHCTLEQQVDNDLALLMDKPRQSADCQSYRDVAKASRNLHAAGETIKKQLFFTRFRGGMGRENRRKELAEGIDYVSFLDMSEAPQNKTEVPENAPTGVWVNGYPRSGSSTILSMVSAAGESVKRDSRHLGDTFSLFEPCHEGDVYSTEVKEGGCRSLLSGILNCNFSGVQKLWGWGNSHTTSNHNKFSQPNAERLCKRSSHIAFKTVDYGHNITEWKPFLDQHPNLRVIDIVRDPRGIYASWKTTKPFSDILQSGMLFYSLTDICDTFAENIRLNSPQVHHIVFEDLIGSPTLEMERVYVFLKMEMGEVQKRWAKSTFNNPHCPKPKKWEVGFTDCHEDSKKVREKWRDVLSKEEIAAFDASPSCRMVVEKYGFPPA